MGYQGVYWRFPHDLPTEVVESIKTEEDESAKSMGMLSTPDFSSHSSTEDCHCQGCHCPKTEWRAEKNGACPCQDGASGFGKLTTAKILIEKGAYLGATDQVTHANSPTL